MSALYVRDSKGNLVPIPSLTGESITIADTMESTASGGSNTVTFSDGTTITILNGKDGGDYVMTEADKTEIAQLVIGLLPTYTGETE